MHHRREARSTAHPVPNTQCTSHCRSHLIAPLAPAELDREIMALKREEAKLVRSIKLEAGKGNNAGARELAKSLVRMRQQQTRLQSSKAQLSGVSNNIRVHYLTTAVPITSPCHH